MTKSFRTSLIALSIAALPFAGHAAGLGQINVFSGLGQPLRAEIQVSATAEELQSLSARIASPDAFRQANLSYGSVVSAIRVSVDTRAARPVIRLSSDRPVNEPFVDLLVELNWASGRLVREYTFLLDPVDIAAPRPLAAAVDTPAAAPAPRAAPPQAAPQRAAAPARAVPETYTVRRGDTMHRIASAHVQSGSTLDQMLVALLRANPQAFDGGNINRLRAGAVLNVPRADAVRAIDPAEARREIRAQAADFDAYRRGLASSATARAPVVAAQAEQESAGRIVPRVEESERPEAAGDQVRVSRSEAAAADGSAEARLQVLEEELTSREKSLEEANARLAQLERSIRDLQRLLELQSGTMGQLQERAAAEPSAEPGAPSAAAQPEAAEVAAEPMTEPALADPAAGEAAPAAGDATPADETLAEAPVAAAPAEPMAAETQPAAPPAPPAAPPPMPVAPVVPPAEPSFMDALLEDPTLVAAGGGVLALLLALLALKARQRRKEAEIQAATAELEAGSLGGNSQAVFGGTGGQSVDTGATSIMHTDFSQSGLSSIDTDEGVDPVAEADVYMAYGRDAQAEEILLDALKADPARAAIKLKLLEIYAQRRNARQFETIAGELFALTGGHGRDWEKAAGMGRKLEPENPLYKGEQTEIGGSATASAPPARDAAAGPARASDAALAAAGAAALTAAVQATPPAHGEPAAVPEAEDSGEAAVHELSSLDFTSSAPVEPSLSQMRDTWTVPGDLSKLTSGNGESSPEPEAADMAPELPADGGVIDFELDLGDEPAGGIDLSVADEAAEGAAPAAGQEDDGGLVFDLDIGDFDEPSAPLGAAEPAAADAGVASDAANSMTVLDNVADFAAPLEFELPDLDTATAPTDALDLNATVVSSDAMAKDMEDEAVAAAPDADRLAPAAKADEPLVDLEKTSFDSSLLDFDFDIDTPPAPETPATMGPAGLDLTSIDLDLENFDDQGVPEIEVVPFEAEATDLGQGQQPGGDAGLDTDFDTPAQAASGSEADSEEADTKLELARAYEEMGDNEGALELLQEVLGEGSARQKQVAREMIGRLS